MTVLAPFWSIHTHSRYSANDALPDVAAMVAHAVDLGYPALALTDHRTVSGVVQLYKACTKAGIKPLPGIELNVAADHDSSGRQTYHLTVVAYTSQGYLNLVRLNNLAQRNFYYIPVVDMADLADLSDQGYLKGLAVSTGCYFGPVIQTLVHRGVKPASQIVEGLAKMFDRVYVELQNHGIEHDAIWNDDEVVLELVDLADTLGLPYVIAQDSHYLTHEEKPLHEALKRLVTFSDDVSEAVFPGDSFHMVDRKWLARYFEPHILDTACRNLADLADLSNVVIPELEKLTMKVPDVTTSGNANTDLRARVYDALRDRALFDNPTWMQAADHELGVMAANGSAGYMLAVAWVCDLMRERDIWFRTRGSASGSVVCYLAGITQVDPIARKLRFDRFMSADRISMPDIDLDVQHDRRDEVVEAIEAKFSVRQVGSHMQYKLEEDEDEEGSSKGSLKVAYFSVLRKQGAVMHKWEDIPQSDREMLESLAKRKLIKGSGTHAAGYIIAPSEASVAELPLTWMTSRKAFVTSYGKKDVEAMGYLKMDLLGLKTLTALRVSCEALGWDEAQLAKVPLDDKDVYKRIGTGKTEGMFQLSGFAMSRGCKEMKPRNLSDLSAAQALFRPQAMLSGATKAYLARRKKKEPVPERHPDIMAETKDTFGTLIFQEQMIALMRRVGMPAAELTDLLGAVKASNEASTGARAYLEQVRPRIRQLVTDRGWSEADVDWLLDGLIAYAEYGFNLSHAESYALVAYLSAYLAVHHPLEFWLGNLTAYANTKKEVDHARSARADGVRILAAHVNKSGLTYTVDRDRQAIRKGLVSVKGVGPIAAAELAEKAPYTSLSDLGERVIARRVSGAKGLALKKEPAECGGVIAALHDYNALDGLET